MSEAIDSTSMSGCLCDPCAWVGVGGASTRSVFTFWRRPFLNVSDLEVCVCVCVLSSEKSCQMEKRIFWICKSATFSAFSFRPLASLAIRESIV